MRGQVLTKKNDSSYIIQCFYQALRYSTVYIKENCQTAIMFSNLGILNLVGNEVIFTYLFPLQSARDIHNMI